MAAANTKKYLAVRHLLALQFSRGFGFWDWSALQCLILQLLSLGGWGGSRTVKAGLLPATPSIPHHFTAIAFILSSLSLHTLSFIIVPTPCQFCTSQTNLASRQFVLSLSPPTSSDSDSLMFYLTCLINNQFQKEARKEHLGETIYWPWDCKHRGQNRSTSPHCLKKMSQTDSLLM